MASGSRLLRANPRFRALWSSRSTSYLGDSMGLVALLLHVAGEQGEAGAVAALLVAGDVVPSLLGPMTGTLGDRFDVRRVLIGCELVQGVIVLLLTVSLPALPLLLALVAVRAVVGQSFQAASRAVVPSLVDDADLEPANAAIGLGAYGMEAIGPLLAALLLPAIGIGGVLAVDAATFAASALFLTRLPALPHEPVTERPSLLADARDGMRSLWSIGVVRSISLGFVAVALFTGVDDVALVFLASDELGGSRAATAALYAGVGVGLVLGFTALGRRRPGRSASRIALAGLALSSGGNLLTGTAWALGAAFAFQAVRGVGNAAIDVGTTTTLQREVPPSLQSRAFGTLYGGVGVAAGGSYLLGALLLEATSARTTFVLGGAGGLVVTALAAVGVGRSRR